jgi:hypothetical protein
LFVQSITDNKKNILSEKTPGNVHQFESLRELFPEALFVFVLRNPFAVFNSFLQVNRRSKEQGREISFGKKNMKSLKTIKKSISVGEKFLKSNSHCCHLLVYENLLNNPDMEIRKLCAFLDVPFEPSMLQNQTSSAIAMSTSSHESAIGFVTAALRNGEVDGKRSAAWKKELTLLQKLQCKIYFKRNPIQLLKRYGL